MKRVLSVCTVLLFGVGAVACGADDGASDDLSARTPATLPAAADAPEIPAAAPEAPAAVPESPAVVPESPMPQAPAPAVVVEAPAQAIPASADVVNVFWAWSIPTISAGTPEKLSAGARAGTTPEAAVQALLAGPNELEREIGMLTSIPAGTRLLGVDVDGGVATVDLSAEINASSGSLEEITRFGQVVFTLTQFADVDGVRFRIDGADVTELGTHGIVATDPLTRGDFGEVRPFILVDRPFPGAVVADGDRLTGDSNTFEATVEFAVTDADGVIVAEGFTTATGGNGTFGRFDAPLELPDGLTGRGAVIVFESSAQDGSQVNVVEYPVFFDDAALPATR